MRDLSFEPEGALQRALHRLDGLAWSLGGMFLFLCNLCLIAMLGLTAATIVLRPFGISAYWIWPWTMVFFVWLSFFGFFAIFVRLKDIRVDFLARMLGNWAMVASRVIGDLSALAICLTILWQLPVVMRTSRGYVDGAIFPSGEELARQALSVPLFVSVILIVLVALLDLAKWLAGMPENVTTHHPDA